MSTITKEWLQHAINAYDSLRDGPFDLDDYQGKILVALRIALASLEAEKSILYRERNPYNGLTTGWQELTVDEYEFVKDNAGENAEFRTVYTAPPAPVSVPDAISTRQAIAKMENHEPCDSINVAYKFGWNACRAATLQGADGTSPVIPDGWVACSERMPDIGTEIFYFCQDDGLRGCGIVSSSNFSARGDAQLYVHADGYDLRFGVDITHWMPLPASPQQK